MSAFLAAVPAPFSVASVVRWLTAAAHWHGRAGIPRRLVEHLTMSGAAVLTALVIALPVGLVLGHLRRGGFLAVNVSNVGRLYDELCAIFTQRPRLNTAAFTDVPDWVCEVTSASHRRLDRTLKLPLYARNGVQHVWLVDPEDKSVEVIRVDPSAKWKTLVFNNPAAPQRMPPFDEAALDLQRWWLK